VLLVHSRDGTVVPYERSDVTCDALRHPKKQVNPVTPKNEDHWLSRSETRLQMLQSSVDFLRANKATRLGDQSFLAFFALYTRTCSLKWSAMPCN
jgi:dipeptidyl aminopeptidase/acylaminoacyl peptidase